MNALVLEGRGRDVFSEHTSTLTFRASLAEESGVATIVLVLRRNGILVSETREVLDFNAACVAVVNAIRSIAPPPAEVAPTPRSWWRFW